MTRAIVPLLLLVAYWAGCVPGPAPPAAGAFGPVIAVAIGTAAAAAQAGRPPEPGPQPAPPGVCPTCDGLGTLGDYGADCPDCPPNPTTADQGAEDDAPRTDAPAAQPAPPPPTAAGPQAELAAAANQRPPAPPPAAAPRAAWETSYAAAQRRAAAEGKPVLVFVDAPNCGPCERVKRLQEIPGFARWIAEHFVPVRLTAGRDALPFGVRVTPTQAVVDRGRVVVLRAGLPTDREGYWRALHLDLAAAQRR